MYSTVHRALFTVGVFLSANICALPQNVYVDRKPTICHPDEVGVGSLRTHYRNSDNSNPQNSYQAIFNHNCDILKQSKHTWEAYTETIGRWPDTDGDWEAPFNVINDVHGIAKVFTSEGTYSLCRQISVGNSFGSCHREDRDHVYVTAITHCCQKTDGTPAKTSEIEGTELQAQAESFPQQEWVPEVLAEQLPGESSSEYFD